MKQPLELHAITIQLLGDCPEDYPIQPKRHTREFLREVAHLRPRTNLFSAVFRIRSTAAYAIHSYFQDRGYVYVHTPLITCADCEGSDQMFKITTLNVNKLPFNKEGSVDFSKDLFGKQAFITGSGQLHGETFAMAFSDIYTFGPTFRTENSNTKTHANEFWMIEPEMAFCDLNGLMDIEEEMLKYIVKFVMERCKEEITFCDQFVEKGLKTKLQNLLNSKFVRISHHDVIDILKKANRTWEFEPQYSEDIAKEQQQMMQAMFAQMQVMQEKLDSLQSKNNEEIIMKGENDERESNSEYVNTEIQSESKSADKLNPVNRKSKNTSKFSKQSD